MSLTLKEHLTVVELRDSRTPKEIAAKFGVTRWAIYKRRARARSKRPAEVPKDFRKPITFGSRAMSFI